MNKEIISPVRSEPLQIIVHQQSKTEKLTPRQIEEAIKMGIKGLTTNNTQYDLLKRVKFQKDQERPTTKMERKLLKKHGRNETRKRLGRSYKHKS